MRKAMSCILGAALSMAVAGIAYGAMSCNNGSCIVTEGKDKADLLACCGAPDMQSSSAKDAKNWDTKGYVNVDTFIYNCGDGRFMKKVIMENDKIKSIESLGPGTGERKCD